MKNVLCTVTFLVPFAYGTIVFANSEPNAEEIEKAKVNLQKITKIVQEKHPSMARKLKATFGESNWGIRNSMALKIKASGDVIKDLNLEISLAENNIGIATVDTYGLNFSIDTDGFQATKRALLLPEVSGAADDKDPKIVEAELISAGKAQCEELERVERTGNVNKDPMAFVPCMLNYHVLKSQNLREFLISVAPLAHKARNQLKAFEKEQLVSVLGPVPANIIYWLIRSDDLTICVKGASFFCRDNYVRMHVSAFLGVMRISTNLDVYDNKMMIGLSAFSVREVAKLAEMGEAIDYQAVRNGYIQFFSSMNDAEIEETAKQLSYLISLAEKVMLPTSTKMP